MCADVWGSGSAVVDVEDRVQERVKLLGHLSYNATVCGDMWSSVWQAIDFDVRIRERINLLRHLRCNAAVCAATLLIMNFIHNGDTKPWV